MPTFADCCARYLRDSAHFSPAWLKCQREYCARLCSMLAGRDVDTITAGDLLTVRAALCERGLMPRTVNHYLSAAAAVLRNAHDHGDLLRLPRVRKLRAARRLRYLTRDEAARLLVALPDYLRVMAAFALETGLRRGNICRLRWSQVDLTRAVLVIDGDETKNRDALCIPLSPGAVAILKSQRGGHAVWCFTWRGKPLRVKLPPTWGRALAAAGLEGLHFHDLRHTWASWHAQRGTPSPALQVLGGWRCAAMVGRYAHLSVEHVRHHAAGVLPVL